jgi:manganese/zinc/iron transport system permease protein
MAFQDLLTDYTLRNVALGSGVLGLVSGALGTFAVLRRQGLVGDALAHAALPGVCLAYMLTGSKTPLVLMLGAALSGWIGMQFVAIVLRATKIDKGSALSLVLTVFFGAGVVLLTVIQKGNDANQAGLDKFLFGQAAALVASQVSTMAILGGLCLVVMTALFKEFKVFTFDPEFAQTIGFPAPRLQGLLTLLLVVTIVIGLNTVGVILMSAMLVAPAAAARQWTHSLSKMIWLSMGFGVLSGVMGAYISVVEENVPTGPVIILILAAIVVFSILFGSVRGIITEQILRRRTHQS